MRYGMPLMIGDCEHRIESEHETKCIAFLAESVTSNLGVGHKTG